MGSVKAKLREKIIRKRMPGLLVPMYEKAARMVIDSYYVPIAEEIIAELSKVTTPFPETGRRMLDLGTGPGYLPIEIAKRVPNLRVDGIDPLLISIKIAKRNADRAEVAERVHFEVGDAAKLRFRENSYDMVISTGMLHELEDPVTVLNECYRVLKPGGKVFIHDPARVSVGIDREKWRASFNLREKIIYRLYTLFFKFKAPDTYSQKEAEEIIAATHFKHYQVEEYWIKSSRELKIKLRK